MQGWFKSISSKWFSVDNKKTNTTGLSNSALIKLATICHKEFENVRALGGVCPLYIPL